MRALPVLSCFLFCSLAAAGEKPEAAPSKLQALSIDAKTLEVKVDAVVCLDAGMLEYMVCRENSMEHETIFSTKCVPSQLHLALLAIGLVPYPMRNDPLWFQGARLKPKARVDVQVEFEKDGKTVRRPVSAFMTRRGEQEGKGEALPDYSVFTGSVFFKSEGKNRYAADQSGIVLGLIPDGSSVVQYGWPADDPYRGDDQGLEVDTKQCPPLGTKVKLVFSPHVEKKE